MVSVSRVLARHDAKAADRGPEPVPPHPERPTTPVGRHRRHPPAIVFVGGTAMRAPRVWTPHRIQAGLNVLGGATFVVGSALFLDPSLTRLGVMCFLFGSSAMFVAALLGWRERS